MKTLGILAVALASAAFGAAATGWIAGSRSHQPSQPAMAGATDLDRGISAVPLGGLAGGLASAAEANLTNPLGNGADTVAKGKQLFRSMNCAGCHGYDGGGGMGPPLNDSYWRYGGSPGEIYATLYQGRPKGMPAWGKALPARDLWELTAYVQSLAPDPIQPGSVDAARHGDNVVGTTAKGGSPTLEGQ